MAGYLKNDLLDEIFNGFDVLNSISNELGLYLIGSSEFFKSSISGVSVLISSKLIFGSTSSSGNENSESSENMKSLFGFKSIIVKFLGFV